MSVPFLDLNATHNELREELEIAFQRVLNSGCFILGPELEALETEFADYCEVNYCVGVGNGLDALHLLLRAYGIGPGDEVIVPSNTFIATWLAVSQCGARPVPVEPDIETHNIDPLRINAAITPRTRAIMPVHLYGQPADMDPINEIASRYDLVVIEDAAQAQGARYKGKRTGSLGHAAGTSFYPGKNLGALGDGGAILTSDRAISDKVRRLRNYGSEIKYQHELMGFNSRLDELQAALLRAKLRMLDSWNLRRADIARSFQQAFAGCGFGLPHVPEWADPVWHLYVVRTTEREALRSFLRTHGIDTMIHYPKPPHQQGCFADYAWDELPIAKSLAQEVLSLPIYPTLRSAQSRHIVKNVKKFYSRRAGAGVKNF